LRIKSMFYFTPTSSLCQHDNVYQKKSISRISTPKNLDFKHLLQKYEAIYCALKQYVYV